MPSTMPISLICSIASSEGKVVSMVIDVVPSTRRWRVVLHGAEEDRVVELAEVVTSAGAVAGWGEGRRHRGAGW